MQHFRRGPNLRAHLTCPHNTLCSIQGVSFLERAQLIAKLWFLEFQLELQGGEKLGQQLLTNMLRRLLLPALGLQKMEAKLKFLPYFAKRREDLA